MVSIFGNLSLFKRVRVATIAKLGSDIIILFEPSDFQLQDFQFPPPNLFGLYFPPPIYSAHTYPIPPKPIRLILTPPTCSAHTYRTNLFGLYMNMLVFSFFILSRFSIPQIRINKIETRSERNYSRVGMLRGGA